MKFVISERLDDGEAVEEPERFAGRVKAFFKGT
jgi:hypothetical protein